MGIVFAVICAAAAFLLLRTVRAFRKAWRDAVIARGPAVSRQRFRFDRAGEMALCLEGPRFRTYSKRLAYGLRDERSGGEIAVAPVFSGAGVRSRTRNRVQRGRVILPAPGEYLLGVEGLAPGDEADYEIVFMRPFTGTLLRFILVCVALGMALIGSFVLAILSAVL